MPSATPVARKPRSGAVEGRELARLAIDAALEKKARDVTVMDLRGISGEVDYFVIATGESDLQLRAIVDSVVDKLRTEAGERPVSREGEPGNARWIVLDYFDLVVHVFAPEQRAYYDLERLWGDAPTETVADDGSDVAFLRSSSRRGATAGAEGRPRGSERGRTGSPPNG